MLAASALDIYCGCQSHATSLFGTQFSLQTFVLFLKLICRRYHIPIDDRWKYEIIEIRNFWSKIERNIVIPHSPYSRQSFSSGIRKQKPYRLRREICRFSRLDFYIYCHVYLHILSFELRQYMSPTNIVVSKI